jgi:hypothetical protein
MKKMYAVALSLFFSLPFICVSYAQTTQDELIWNYGLRQCISPEVIGKKVAILGGTNGTLGLLDIVNKT